MPSIDLYPVLAPGRVLRKLETRYVYDIPNDQLYELDDEAFAFLRTCDGGHPLSEILALSEDDAQDSIEFMRDEGILTMHDGPSCEHVQVKQSPIPSLRYLLMNITDRCNLACKHCYLGGSGNKDMEMDLFEKAVAQFEDMGGLKLMISGGEPFLHRKFWELLGVLPSYGLRIVILSNGTLIGKKEAKKLSEYVDEIQVSIDGIKTHDMLRGNGSYEKAMSGISHLQTFGVPLSIATMAHTYNIEEFENMKNLFSGLNVLSWSVDVPCVTGSLEKNRDFVLPLEKAALSLQYGFGAGAHESTGNYTCGSHLCAITTGGEIVKCGFFEDEPVGKVHDLPAAWTQLCKNYLWTMDELECRNCTMISDCRGGCRFRAKLSKGILAPDPLLCHANGVLDFL